MSIPKGNYRVHISDAVLDAVGEEAAMKCISKVSGDPDRFCSNINTQFGPTRYCRCKGSKGTLIVVFIYRDGRENVIDCRLPYEFGLGN